MTAIAVIGILAVLVVVTFVAWRRYLWSLTFAELDAQAENIAAAISRFLTGPDQVVAVAMSQDNPQIVAAHLGILKAGGTFQTAACVSSLLRIAGARIVAALIADHFS